MGAIISFVNKKIVLRVRMKAQIIYVVNIQYDKKLQTDFLRVWLCFMLSYKNGNTNVLNLILEWKFGTGNKIVSEVDNLSLGIFYYISNFFGINVPIWMWQFFLSFFVIHHIKTFFSLLLLISFALFSKLEKHFKH